MSNWLEGLNVAEDFLAQAAASMPTASEFNRRYVCRVENCIFREASDKYRAQVQDLEANQQYNQAVFEGVNHFNDKEMKAPLQLSCGKGFSRDSDDGGNSATKVKSDEGYEKFSGRSKYGEFISELSQKFGVTADNEHFFKQVNPETNEEFICGPEYRRFVRWYVKRNEGRFPDWKDATIWNGTLLQMDGEKYQKNGKDAETTKIVGLAGFVDETPEEFNWYINMLTQSGSSLPWYVLAPGQSVEDRDNANAEAAGEAAPKTTTTNGTAPKANGTSTAPKTTSTPPASKPAESAPAASTPPASTPAPTSAPASGGDADILGQLSGFAIDADGNYLAHADWRKAALTLVKTMPKWIQWIAKTDNYEALKKGEAVAPK